MIEAQDAVLVEKTDVGRFQVQVHTGDHVFLADEPVSFGGLSTGPNPFDLICAALGSCTVMTMRLYAERKGWSLDGLGVRVTHRRGSPGGRDRFERVLHLGDVTAEQRERLVFIAERCPVHVLLEGGADVTTAVAETALTGGIAQGLHAQVIEALCDECTGSAPRPGFQASAPPA
ncbi:MAG TPA: OsmC family protein [Sphingomonas sp.]|nr:OsmC family protein [Sphingomonas sp.]